MTAGDDTVLVVDDDPDFRRTIVEYLTAEGLTVVEAEHGLAALLHVKRLRPPVVVIDLVMPRVGGLEAIKRILAFSPETTVIVVTGTEDPDLHRRARDLGATTILKKPFALPDLSAAIGAHIRIPGGSSAPADGRAAPADGRAAPADGRAARVLIVDDEPDIRDTLADLLAPDGYVIHTAADGAAALKTLVEHQPDLVLLDIDMPRLRGVEALVAMRELSPATKVIMMSGKADADEARRSLASGAFDYVTKPFDFVYLIQAIRTAIVGVE